YNSPSATAVTAMLTVIHSGPSTERRYRCLMSCQPRCPHSWRCRQPAAISPNALPNVRLSGEALTGGSAVTKAIDEDTPGEPACAAARRDARDAVDAGQAARHPPPLEIRERLQVLAPADGLLRNLARLGAGGQGAAPHLLQLNPGGHLLGEQRGLDSVEQALQPAHQLSLRDP